METAKESEFFFFGGSVFPIIWGQGLHASSIQISHCSGLYDGAFFCLLNFYINIYPVSLISKAISIFPLFSIS
jgi:hypothetical protein